jgi:hypothetical protein
MSAVTQEKTMSDTKFAEFVKAKKLDPRRIMRASHALEALQVEDRAIRLAKRRAKGSEAGDDKTPKETRKARSGRPVTDRAMTAAMKGGKISGPTKTRILRAINHLLEQKKQEKVELRTLF